MPSVNEPDRKYWQSLDDLADTARPAGEAGAEFAPGAADPPKGHTRRRFLQIMAASTGLAGLTSCRWPKEPILPYGRRPPELTPGVPLQFATSRDVGGFGQGLVVSSYDGRPIKVDGNALHPISLGASDAVAQASVLELYDPDRSRLPIWYNGQQFTASTWEAFMQFVRTHFDPLRQAQGRGLYVLSEASSSPSVAAMRALFQQAYPQARWHEYEAVSFDNERNGTRIAFGRTLRPHYALDQAQVIVCLNADLFATHPAALKLSRDFVAGHTAEAPEMSRLYVLEPEYSITGGMADHRWPVPASEIPQVAAQLATALLAAGLEPGDLPAGARDALRQAASAAQAYPFLDAIVQDLLAHRGRGVIVAGAGQPPEVHALVHALNVMLGAVGRTVQYTEDPEPGRPAHIDSIRMLAGDISAGRVATLVVLGGDPVYNGPADLTLGDLLTKVQTTVHLSLYRNATSQIVTWHLPMAHYLESWGDVRAYDGTLSTMQPLIRPLYDGRSVIELLSLLAEAPPQEGYAIVRRTIRQLHAPDADDAAFEAFWRELLHNGVLPDTGLPPVQPRLEGLALQDAFSRLRAPDPALGPQNLEIVFREDPYLYDGRYANNGWLLELPQPMTKLTWDNAALLAPATAAALDLHDEDVVVLQFGGRQVLAPVYVAPGHAPYSVTVALGYGQALGRVSRGAGFNAYTLRTSDAPHVAAGLTITKTGRRYPLAITQIPYAADAIGRQGIAERLPEIVREATLAEYREHPHFVEERAHEPPLESLWEEFEYTGYKWGMAIDFHRCVGCNACVVACQSENNVPIVGKEQVRNSRHMHWLRIDRYFAGEPGNPQVTYQPMFCVHCEMAPCESVCPVAATLHDVDGLNLMVYNRCVGTRYCSNNCPYKVRRFNFFNYRKEVSPQRAMQMNPDVTVRGRGVMEKCTYCVQRIQRAKIQAKNEGRPVREGEIVPACVQACPTRAIVFGDLNNPDSEVARLHRHARAYAVLGSLNTKPRSLHMARIRNPNPALLPAAGGRQD